MAKSVKQLIHVLWAIEKDLHVIASNKRSGLITQLKSLESAKKGKSHHDVDAILGIDTKTGSVETYFDDLEQLKKALSQEIDNSVIRISIRKLEI